MMERQIVLVLLIQFVVSTTTGQSCIKRFVGGKIKSYGDCESQKKQHSIVSQIQSSAKEEEQGRYCQADKSLEITQIPVRLANGSTISRSASLNSGWTIFQRRKNGSLNFTRTWTEYVNGFGAPCGEDWLGLEAIHQLTKTGNYELRFDMTEKDTGTRYYAVYSTFKVGPASNNYTLTLNGYSGNATDALANPPGVINKSSNGVQFSTYDIDNDRNEGFACATQSGGGWWHNSCSLARPNGKYDGFGWSGFCWFNTDKKSTFGLSQMEIKLRAKTA